MIWSRLVRIILLCIPPLLIAWAGFGYLKECYATLLAPGTGFRHTLETDGGNLTLEAALYEVTEDRLKVEGLTVTAEEGQILSIEKGEIDYPKLAGSGFKNIDAEASGVFARIRRLKDGTFNFQKYLPKPTEEVEENPVRVVVRDAKVDLTDEVTSRPYQVQAFSPEVLYEGLGEAFVAAGLVRVPNVGEAQLAIRQLPKAELTFDALTGREGLQVADLLRHAQALLALDRDPLLKDVSLGSGRVTGRVAVRIPVKGDLRMRFDGNASASQLRYKEWSATSLIASGSATQAGFSGVATARESQTDGRFQGTATWGDRFVAGGNALVNAPSVSGLPTSLQPLLPKELTFRGGRMAGWVGLDGEAFRIRGELQASNGRWQDYRLSKLGVQLDANPTDVLARASGAYQGLPTEANIAYNFKARNLAVNIPQASLTVSQIRDLLPNLREPLKNVDGTVRLAGIVSGPADRPTVHLRGAGSGRILASGRRVEVRSLDLQALLDGNRFALERAFVDTNLGTAALVANVDPQKGTIRGRVLASGDLSRIDSSLQGAASLVGNIEGDFGNPRLNGRVYAYGAGTPDIEVPFAQANLIADSKRVTLREIKAGKSTAALTGILSLRYEDQRIDGRVSLPGVMVQEFTNRDEVRGLVDLDLITLSGTIPRPRVFVQGKGDRIVAQNVLLRDLTFSGRYDGEQIELTEARTRIAEGNVKAAGSFQPKTGVLAGRAEIEGVHAQNLAAVQDLDLALKASLSGFIEASGTTEEPRFRTEGKLEDVTIDETLFGDGFWTVAGDLNEIQGELEVGSLERYLRVENLVAHLKDETASGTLVVFRNQIADYVAAARRNLREVSYEARRVLDGLNGEVDAEVAFEFNKGELDFNASVLDAANVRIGEDQLASLTAQISRENRVWQIGEFELAGEALQATIRGNVDERGDANLDGEITGFRLDLLSKYAAGVPPLDGKADLSFVTSGWSKNPRVTASFFASETLDTGENLVLQLAPITIVPGEGRYATGEITGSVQYKNLTANLLGSLPIDWASGLRPDDPISGSVEIRSELVKVDEAGSIGLLDPTRTKGEVAGSLRIAGTPQSPTIQGTIAMAEADLALRNFETSMRGVTVNAEFRRNDLRITATGQSSRGGTLSATVQATPPSLDEIIADLRDGVPDQLFATELSGNLTLSGLRIREEGLEFGEAGTTLSGTVAISGPVNSPLVSGRVDASNSQVGFVFQPLAEGAPFVPPVNPRFDLRFVTQNPFRFESTGADLRLRGDARLTGSLTAPNLEALFTLTEGNLRLPNARVRLEPGGTVRPLFRLGSQTDSVSQILLDVEGRTSITASRFANQPERFEITLGVRGDLIQEGGMIFSATSEPAGLSQETILATIGTGDLLNSLSGGLERNNQFGQALLNVAIPVFLSGFTDSIARGLGLDYIGLTFDQRQVPTVSFYETLGRGFFVDGSRQFGERPAYGEEVPFELRIGYRLPTSRRGLDRYRLILGTDQIRPWKFGLDYSARYGNVPPLSSSKKTVISGTPGVIPPPKG